MLELVGSGSIAQKETHLIVAWCHGYLAMAGEARFKGHVLLHKSLLGLLLVGFGLDWTGSERYMAWHTLEWGGVVGMERLNGLVWVGRVRFRRWLYVKSSSRWSLAEEDHSMKEQFRELRRHETRTLWAPAQAPFLAVGSLELWTELHDSEINGMQA